MQRDNASCIWKPNSADWIDPPHEEMLRSRSPRFLPLVGR